MRKNKIKMAKKQKKISLLRRIGRKIIMWPTKHKKWIFIILIVVFGFNWWLRGDEEIRFYTDEVVKSDVNQIVYVTGTVESDVVVNLKFKQLGTVESVYVKEGDRVEENDYLIELDNDKLEINANRAKANLGIARAELNLEYAGPKSQEVEIFKTKIKEAEVNLENAKRKLKNAKLVNKEEIKTAELEVDNAQIDLDKARKNRDNTESSGETDVDISNQALEDAYDDSKADIIDALDMVQEVLFLIDDFLGIDSPMDEADYSEILKDTASLQEKVDLQNSYVYSGNFYDDASDAYSSIKLSWDDENNKIEKVLDLMEDSLLEAKEAIDILYKIVEEADTYGSVTQADLNTLATTYSTKQGLLSTSIKAIKGVKQEIVNAKLGLTSTDLSSTSGFDIALAQFENAENDLKITKSALEELKIEHEIEISDLEMDITIFEVKLQKELAEYNELIAAPRSVDVASLIARIARDQADYEHTLDELNDSILKSPAGGIVTKVNLDVGENVSDVIEDAVTIMTDELRITTNISETDISKVKVGNLVDITFDAFPSDKLFTGKVVSIDPAETIVQGVVYYEAKVDFDPDGENIKSGMTANFEIMTASVDSAIAISPQALNYEDKEVFVFVIEEGEKIKRVLKTGLEGDEMIEILDGLNEGEKILIYENNK